MESGKNIYDLHSDEGFMGKYTKSKKLHKLNNYSFSCQSYLNRVALS
jgi:hypothetical protein